MAKRITDLTNKNAATTQNPDGSLKDTVFVGGSPTEVGSKIFGSYIQDVLNVFHRAGRRFNKYLNGTADTQLTSQYYDWFAAAIHLLGSNFYSADWETPNKYFIETVDGPLVYSFGLQVRFVVPLTNTETTVTVSAQNIGYLPVANNGDGDLTVRVGELQTGDVVTLQYYSNPTSPHWRIVKTPLSALSDGTSYFENVAGTIKEIFQFARDNLTLTKQITNVAGDTILQAFESAVGNTKITSKYTDNEVTEPYNRWMRLDGENGYIEAAKQAIVGGSELLAARMQFGGLSFVGGPNAATTDSTQWRLSRITLPESAVTFKVDTSISGVSTYWRAVEFVDGTTTYWLDTNVGNALIFGMWATFTDTTGVVRNAPCSFNDQNISGTGSRTGVVSFTVNTGNASQRSSWMPVAEGSQRYIEISILYNGVGIS